MNELRASDLLAEDEVDDLVASAVGELTGESVLVHFVEDGFTALEAVWYRGQELEVEVGSELWKATCDRTGGNSWMTLTDHDQLKRFGRVMFRRGPWPFDSYEDEKAKEEELKRSRRPPIYKPGFVASRS